MGLSTKEKGSKPTGKKAKIADLKEKHQPLFEAEGVTSPKWIPKMAYMPKAGADRVIALFPSEISGGTDVYTEFVSADYDPEDPERTLWKWEYNPHYDEEYEKTAPHPVSGHCRYLIPCDELINVAEIHQGNVDNATPKEESSIDFDAWPDPDGDSPIKDLTIRDKCAIDWKKPVSKKKWLNNLIRETYPENE
jgi:hypothetical protein